MENSNEQIIKKLNESLRLAPSKRAIYNLTKDLLLKHNALIFHKGSSLSSAQRKMVQERISYGINALIQSELTKAISTNDNSSTEEPA